MKAYIYITIEILNTVIVELGKESAYFNKGDGRMVSIESCHIQVLHAPRQFLALFAFLLHALILTDDSYYKKHHFSADSDMN